MSKKHKDKKGGKKSNPAHPGKLRQFQDMTAERQFNMQMARAEKFYAEHHYKETLEILEPLAEKYSDRPGLLDLLGVTYASAGLLVEARDALGRALELTSTTTGNAPMQTRFNLAQLYLLTGFTFLAYEQSLLLDCSELSRQTHAEVGIATCTEFKHKCREMMEEIAISYELPFAQFVPYALNLDRGRLAISHTDLTKARQYFEEAIALQPRIAVPYNNLALIYFSQHKLEQALAQSQYVLDKIDPQNIHALSNQVRMLVTMGQREKAHPYFGQLKALRVLPDNPDDLVKLVEAHIVFDEDQAIYDLLQTLLGDLSSHNPRQLLKHLDPIGYQQALTYGMVASANLGKLRQALELAELLMSEVSMKDGSNVLIERTYYALQNNERGPREEGRFFYWSPETMYPEVTAYFRELAEVVITQNRKSPQTMENYGNALRLFFEKYGKAAEDFIAYTWWITQEPRYVVALLTQVLASKASGVAELVRRLAFGRGGEDAQRMHAAETLLHEGLIEPQEQVTIWLGLRPQIGTVDELGHKLELLLKNQAEQEEADNQETDSPEAVTMANEALEMMRQRNYDQAESLYRQVLKKAPRLKQAYNNLASIMTVRGNFEEARKLIERSLQLDPHYTMGQINLAQLYLEDNRLEEGEAQLSLAEQNLSGKYLDELKAFYHAKIKLYQKQERYPELLQINRQLLAIDPENQDLQDNLARLTLLEKMSGFGNWLGEMRENYRAKRWKQWGKLLKPDVTLAKLVELYTKDELVAILSALRYYVKTTLPKNALKEQLLAVLQDRENDEHLVVHVMNNEDRLALKTLLELGGYASYQVWQQKAGFEDGLYEENPHANKNQPWEKLPGRLISLGIVFIGEVKKDQVMAVVPADLRNPLLEILNKRLNYKA